MSKNCLADRRRLTAQWGEFPSPGGCRLLDLRQEPAQNASFVFKLVLFSLLLAKIHMFTSSPPPHFFFSRTSLLPSGWCRSHPHSLFVSSSSPSLTFRPSLLPSLPPLFLTSTSLPLLSRAMQMHNCTFGPSLMVYGMYAYYLHLPSPHPSVPISLPLFLYFCIPIPSLSH
jgi:hypothetical protein